MEEPVSVGVIQTPSDTFQATEQEVGVTWRKITMMITTVSFSTAQVALLFALVVGFFCLLLTNLASGYELGDHGFYLLHLRQPEAISYTLTQFGLVWDFLVGDRGIVSNRLANICLIVLSGVSLALVTPIVANRPFKMRRVLTGMVIAAAASGTYFASFILDPSYNGVALILVMLGVSVVTLWVEMARRGQRGLALVAAGIIGALVAALVFTKASTAVGFSVFLLAVAGSMAVTFRSGSLFLGLLIAGLFGFGVFLGLFQLVTGMVPHVVESFSNGLRVYSSGGSHSLALLGIGAVERLYYFLRGGASALLRGGWMIALPALAALTTCTPLMQRLADRARFWIVVLAVAAIMAMALLVVLRDASSTSVGHQMITVFALGILVTLSFWPAARLTASGHVLVAGTALVPFLTVFGTTNSYISQIMYIGAGLSLLPAWIVLSAAPEGVAAPARQVVLALAGFAMILSAHNVLNYPYRLGGDLASARESVLFPGGEVLNVTPPVAAFVSGLRPYAHPQGAKDAAPTVFDLTGQLPIAVYLLNGRPAGAAWFIDSFGPRFSRAVFADLDDSAFLDGWVLVRQNAAGGVDESAPHFRTFVDRLEGLGTSFEERFKPVATVTAPNWGQADETLTVMLYKPFAQQSTATIPLTD